MNRVFVFLVITVTFVISGKSSGGTVGFTSICENGACFTSASSSLISTILGISLLVFLTLYKQKGTELNSSKPVGVWQRLGAFFIDFVVVLSAITPLITLPILLVEGQATGAFEWSFIRQFGRPTDAAIVFPGMLLMFAALFCYFYLQAKHNRATLGQYILGYKIIAGESGAPNYFFRTFLSYIGLCAWPISLFFALKRHDKKFWWDTKSQTAAVSTTATLTDKI